MRASPRRGPFAATVPKRLDVEHQVEPEHGEQEARPGRDGRGHPATVFSPTCLGRLHARPLAA